MRFRRFILCSSLGILFIFALSGCMGFDHAKGPAPFLDGSAVRQASDNKAIILAALAADAGYNQGVVPDWYAVTEAGFNYVDDTCRAYFDELFFLNKGREQLKSGLTSAGQTTSAILAVTGAASPTLAIVAQAFGFANSEVDVVTGTYLYGLPPATTLGFVEKFQLAYRDAAEKSRRSINSPTTAYYQIQRYLNLCLPPKIEAEIAKQIDATTTFGVATSDNGLFTVQASSNPPLAQSSFIRPTVIKQVDQSLPHLSRRPLIPASTTDSVILSPEINKYDVKTFRQLVQLSAIGKLDQEAVAKLKQCLQQLDRVKTPINTLNYDEVISLRYAVEAHSCKPQ